MLIFLDSQKLSKILVFKFCSEISVVDSEFFCSRERYIENPSKCILAQMLCTRKKCDIKWGSPQSHNKSDGKDDEKGS